MSFEARIQGWLETEVRCPKYWEDFWNRSAQEWLQFFLQNSKKIGWIFLKVLLCFVLFSGFYRVSQKSLYYVLETNLPHSGVISFERNQIWFGFEVRGVPENGQTEILKNSLLRFSDLTLQLFSEGKSVFKGMEPSLIFYVLSPDAFQDMAPWYYRRKTVRQLEAFYSDGKIFIRSDLSPNRFLETITHELAHAQSDYLIQQPWYFQFLQEKGNLLDQIGPALELHKKNQARKVLQVIKTEKQRSQYLEVYSYVFDGKPLDQNLLNFNLKEKLDLADSISCCFVSLYAFLGDQESPPLNSSEYWAEGVMTFLLNPLKLKKRDPVFFQAIQRFDGELRTTGHRDRAIDLFLYTLTKNNPTKLYTVNIFNPVLRLHDGKHGISVR